MVWSPLASPLYLDEYQRPWYCHSLARPNAPRLSGGCLTGALPDVASSLIMRVEVFYLSLVCDPPGNPTVVDLPGQQLVSASENLVRHVAAPLRSLPGKAMWNTSNQVRMYSMPTHTQQSHMPYSAAGRCREALRKSELTQRRERHPAGCLSGCRGNRLSAVW